MKNPWLELPVNGKLVLPDDEPLITKANSHLSDNFRYHLELFPEPYIGNIESQVVALNLNPGVDEKDIIFHSQSHLRQIMMDNLLHKSKDFYYLRNDFSESPGSGWWRKRLKSLIESTSIDKVKGGFQVIEATGYHSLKFKDIDIPSNNYCDYLVTEAIKRNALIIIMRGESIWKKRVPLLESYFKSGNVLKMNNPQQPYFSQKNLPGYNKIVNILNLETTMNYSKENNFMNFDKVEERNFITDGSYQRFFASEFFSPFGIPVPKDSLVEYDGNQKLTVLRIKRDKIEKDFQSWISWSQKSEKNDLPFMESDIVEFSRAGTFHPDDFDLNELLDRINSEPELKFNDINFSSLVYSYNIKEKRLLYFITTKSSEFVVNNMTIYLPKLLEIAFDGEIYNIYTLTDTYYHGVTFNSKERLRLDINTGCLEGPIGKEFKARIVNSSRKGEIIFSEGLLVRITPSGTIYSKLLNENSHRVEEYQLDIL